MRGDVAGRWFRPDIEGMRGIAIGLVLLAHSGLAFAEGGYIGIDVFFVISGFLITTLLVREHQRSGTISLPAFYARRIRRLLPAAAVVLLAIVVLAQLMFSPVRNELLSGDVLSALAYFVNWHLAAQSVDYFAQGFDASPVQHFWSLAVEEQFYVVWPVTMLILATIALRLGRPVRPTLGIAAAVAGIGSLAYSAYFTGESPTVAYFSTLTRIWELAFGALLAVLHLPRVGERAAAALSWLGLAAIVASFLALDESTPFPGVVGVVPALGVVAVLYAGSISQASVPMRMLASAPFQYVGRISYSWYLWHWPFVIFAAAAFGPLTPFQGALAVAASWIPTALTYRYVEQPVRRSTWLTARPRRAVAILAVGSGTTALAALALAAVQPQVPLAPSDEVEGALALRGGKSVQTSAAALRPDAASAFEDRTKLFDDGCFIKVGETEQGECAYGDVDSDTTVVLFGDSHGEHYFPALERLALERNWRLVALTKSFCSPALIDQEHPTRGGEFTDCYEWRENSFARIAAEDPELVVVAGQRDIEPFSDGEPLAGAQAEEALVAGYAETLERLAEAGPEVALVTDLPQSDDDIPTCVSEHPDELGECAFPAPGGRPLEAEAVAQVPGARLIDTVGSAVCAAETCRAVIGDAIVYRDRGHLTATFAATLAPVIGRQLPEFN